MKHHLKTMFATGHPDRRCRGVALVMVLWVLALLALIAASFATNTRTEVNLARNLVEGSKAEALAEAGVHQAIVGLLAEGGAEPWRVDGTVYAWRFATGEIRVAIQDEGGKIDLNTARPDILRGLFLAIGLDLQEGDAFLDAILDFRDPDDLRHVNGAEDPDYAAADLDHDAKDAPFEIVDELQQVYGMTREIYEQVASALTVHSRRPAPDERIAPPLVLQALSGTPDEADEQEADEQDANADLPEPGELSPEEISETPGVLKFGDSEDRSGISVYTVHAEGRAQSGAVFALDAVVRLGAEGGEPYEFLAWRRGRRELFEDERQDEADGA
jgi:general secretion pathway protein K